MYVSKQQHERRVLLSIEGRFLGYNHSTATATPWAITHHRGHKAREQIPSELYLGALETTSHASILWH